MKTFPTSVIRLPLLFASTLDFICACDFLMAVVVLMWVCVCTACVALHLLWFVFNLDHLLYLFQWFCSVIEFGLVLILSYAHNFVQEILSCTEHVAFTLCVLHFSLQFLTVEQKTKQNLGGGWDMWCVSNYLFILMHTMSFCFMYVVHSTHITNTLLLI